MLQCCNKFLLGQPKAKKLECYVYLNIIGAFYCIGANNIFCYLKVSRGGWVRTPEALNQIFKSF